MFYGGRTGERIIRDLYLYFSIQKKECEGLDIHMYRLPQSSRKYLFRKVCVYVFFRESFAHMLGIANCEWFHMDPIFAHFMFMCLTLDPSNLRFSSSAGVAVLLRWSYGALARRLSDCLLQQVLPSSGEGGAMTARRVGTFQCL